MTGDGTGIFAGSGPTPSSHCHGLEIETVLSRHPAGALGVVFSNVNDEFTGNNVSGAGRHL